MMRNVMKVSMAMAAVAAFAGTAPVSAMQQDLAVARASEPEPRTAKAATLKAEAETLFSQPKQWRRAARLLEQSAQLRDAGDPEAYTCLVFAGRLRAATGDHSGARAALEKAGEHAMARGAVLDAAHAFVDAAHVAVEQKDRQGVSDLLVRAALLAQSPLLSADESQQIRRRLQN